MKYNGFNREEEDDGLFTNSDLDKSINNFQKQVDIHLSKLGQILKTPISSEFRNTLVGLIVKIGKLEQLNTERNRRRLKESLPNNMKWS